MCLDYSQEECNFLRMRRVIIFVGTVECRHCCMSAQLSAPLYIVVVTFYVTMQYIGHNSHLPVSYKAFR